MKVGLFFGSFNPIHNGHLMMANYCLNELNLDYVRLIISPLNPMKESSTLASFEDRLNMASDALFGNDKIIPSSVENGSLTVD